MFHNISFTSMYNLEVQRRTFNWMNPYRILFYADYVLVCVSPRECKEANLFPKKKKTFLVSIENKNICFLSIQHLSSTMSTCCRIFIFLISIFSGSRGPWSMCYATHNVLLCSGSRYNAIFTLRHGQGKNAVHS